MKKSDWLIASATLTYSYLFYQQLAGINFFIFSILMAFAFVVMNKEVLKNKMWLLFAVMSILTSFFIMWHNSNLAVFANICSLALLSAYSIDKKASVILNGFYSLYSIGGSYVFIILNTIKRSGKKENPNETSDTKKARPNDDSVGRGMKFLIISAVVILVLIFFFIYKNANPLFEKYTEKINLDFISGMWILFTLAGFFIVYGMLKPQRINQLDEWENSLPLQLIDTGKISKKFEKFSGNLLFVMLNLMLVFINLLDIIFLYAGDKLPEDITHSQFVHNGVGMLILSIVLGVSIVLYIFRNAMNFDKGNRALKFLISLWILQNIMMIFSTSLRNYMYVLDYSLTYKRIGVFVYLSLTVIGLVTTLIKIHGKKSNWYLIKTNALCGVLFLCISATINWDKTVCEFNIARKADTLQTLDKKYLLGLSDESIPYLQSLKNKSGFDTDSAKKDWYRGSGDIEAISGYNYVNDFIKNSDEADSKAYNFLKKVNEYPDWQSWNKRNASIVTQLNKLNVAGQIKTLSIKNHELDSLQLLKLFNNATEVNLSGSRGNQFAFLETFKNLNSLDVSSNGIKKLSELPSLPKVKDLNLSSNQINDLSELTKFKALETLSLTQNPLISLNSLPLNTDISSLDLSYCTSLNDLGALSRTGKLTQLYLNNIGPLEKFPTIRSLTNLSMDNQPNVCNENLNRIPMLENLQTLSLANNEKIGLIHLWIYNQQTKTYSLRFPELTTLILTNNSIEYAENISGYRKLKKLDLRNNKLRNVSFLSEHESLEDLNLSYNALDTLAFTEKHKSIRILSLSGNAYMNHYSALKWLTSLETLDVSGTRFSSLRQLNCSGTLKELNISNCRVNSLTELSVFKSLEILSVTGVKEADIETLKKLKNLKHLHIYNSIELSKEVKEKLKKQLPNTKIELL